jgi:molecular chaperone GrpE
MSIARRQTAPRLLVGAAACLLVAALGWALAELSFLLASPSSFRSPPRAITAAARLPAHVEDASSPVSIIVTSATAASSLAAAALLALRRRRRATRQVCRLFGGNKEEEKKDEKEAEEEEAEEEEEEELSEKAKVAIEKMEQEIEEFKELAAEKQSAHDRLTVEINNFRKRTREELAAARGQAAIPLVKDLMPIADDFELAKNNLKVEGDGEREICDRFDDLFAKMLASWKKLGVEKLTAEGEEFNPEFHEAVSMIPSGDYKDGIVCNELRAGWVLKPIGADTPQVLRPSLVCVSSGPGPS